MQLEDIQQEELLLGKGDDFHFFMPVEIIQKSENGKNVEGDRLIRGIASTDDRDLQGEVVVQKGIDYSYFLKKGWINDDHQKGPKYKVGEPVDCKITKDGMWIKARLYKGVEKAEEWWNLIKALKENNSNRKVGFSIEGKVLRRNGKTIQKCWITEMAITASPVNTNTWAEIVKSLSSQTWCLHPYDNTCVGGCCSCNTTKSIDEDELDLEKEKALTTVSGGALVPESLEGSNKVQTHKSSRITFDEAVNLVMARGYSESNAKVLTDAVFTAKGIH